MRLTTGRTYDHKKIINKLIINQDVLLRTSITQVRRHIDDGRPEDTDDKKMIKRLKNNVRHITRSTYDLSVRTEVGRKSTTKCILYGKR
jgi:signal transduction histidine kinase